MIKNKFRTRLMLFLAKLLKVSLSINDCYKCRSVNQMIAREGTFEDTTGEIHTCYSKIRCEMCGNIRYTFEKRLERKPRGRFNDD